MSIAIKPKVAVMFSGGMDSTVVLASLLKDGYDVIPMCYDDDSLTYKLRKSVAVEKILQHYQILNKLQVIRLYHVEPMRGNDTFGFIPGWKMAMQVSAMAYCQHLGISELHMGYNSGNSY